ncbi:MAG: hypothetical protein RBS34_11655 [Desulfofustis sp.]|jgi:hypothetical protein|nr:hypothetical protein [Desulfofustis sp.]
MGFDIAEERLKNEEAELKKQRVSVKNEQKRINRERLKKGAAAFREGFRGGYICGQCGHLGKPKLITKGSILVELFAWIVGIGLALFSFGITLILAIVYSFWRHLSRFKGCPQCQGQMIATDSPVGRRMIEEYHRKSQ